MENGLILLYLRIFKVLYGCIYYVVLWCDIYAKTLKSQGFMVNPYYRCIANRTIDGKYFTIDWYVDNNKVYHVDKHINTRIIEAIAENLVNSLYK